ncbi:hypothetical protein KFK09_023822 [Dendrobium nobile]|uniref:Uncharacterized protein n=1 Tax=Dendrobium nobile TaxID=94219 RepID=A0A8T3AC57_DENNO|nr:hypothetical protein KFK09_023822 [Dendrobium nobile]
MPHKLSAPRKLHSVKLHNILENKIKNKTLQAKITPHNHKEEHLYYNENPESNPIFFNAKASITIIREMNEAEALLQEICYMHLFHLH